MTEQTENQFIYKDKDTSRPRGLMLLVSSGVFLLLIKYNIFSLGKMGFEKFAWFFLVVGLLFILFSSNLTVIADKSSRKLQLRYRYLFFQRTKEIPFDDIADIQAHSDKGNLELPSNANAYVASSGSKLVAVLKDGTLVAFRRTFTPYVNSKQAAIDLRFAVTGSRQSDVIKVKPTEYTLPIKMTVYLWAKAIFVFSIIAFGFLAIWSFSSHENVFVSLEFVFFVLLGVYTLISSGSFVEVDKNTITVSSPPHGVYMMNWQDVQLIETNGAAFAFLGDDKQLVISIGFVGNGKREFLAFFNDFVQERQIEVKPITTPRLRQKNTKVS